MGFPYQKRCKCIVGVNPTTTFEPVIIGKGIGRELLGFIQWIVDGSVDIVVVDRHTLEDAWDEERVYEMISHGFELVLR